MPFLALVGIGLLIAVVIVPWVALSKANNALAEIERLRLELARLAKRISELTTARDPSPTRAPETAAAAKQASVAARVEQPVEPPPASPSPASIARPEPTPAPLPQTSAPQPARVPPSFTPPAPRQPSAFELQLREWLVAAKEWLFGGNLVAKIGLLILFIGVAFLVRLASNYVTVPIEFRLAGIVAGAVALLVWAWRIRETRRGIALPAQGAALAIMMLTTFGAFKLFHVLPGGAAFALLFVLIAFTCALAVLQDALWLAVFGIAGGFAAPVLTSSGGGSHIALFSYYSLLNAGVLFIALKRSWRALNVLGFAFTFIIGAAWGEQRYAAEHYASAQAFLIEFWFFYLAIAIVYAWRRAPLLKSYVDGTLVFGAPMAGMALQYGLVKDKPFGMAISALVIALVYASTASALWRWRRGSLRLLVESFLAMAIVFGTLAIPLALDGRWTSAAWAVEGAAIVWVGLKQKQKLAWRFGVAVQLASWIAFVSALAGLDPLAALKGNVGLGFLLLGVTGGALALMFRRALQGDQEGSEEQRARQALVWLANAFICVAALWLLLGLWVEVWLRFVGPRRATLLVVAGLMLVYALHLFGKKANWRLPDALGGIVAAVVGVEFWILMSRHMEWRNVAYASDVEFGEMLTGGSLLGGLMLCGGALASAFAFKRQAQSTPRVARVVVGWLLAAIFWWCGFALHGLAHAVEYLTAARGATTAPWYALSFWATYGVGLALSAWAWTAAAQRWQFPNARWIASVLWPALTMLATYLFWRQIAPQVQWAQPNWSATLSAANINDVLVNVAASALLGALMLCAIVWRALRIVERAADLDADAKRLSLGVWTVGFCLVWYGLVVDALATGGANLVAAIERDYRVWLPLSYRDCAILIATASGMIFLTRARAMQLLALRWVALPAAAVQALVSAALLLGLYLNARLPSLATGVAMLGCWLGVAWGLRYWRANNWPLSTDGLRVLHFGRVIAPWLAIAPIVSLNAASWLQEPTANTPVERGWIVAGLWPDYLAAWLGLTTLLALLRQAKRGGWPLAPLHEWHRRALIPLATIWGVLLVIYWNLRQNGNMAPLPYLPILNPLDLTTGFAALLSVHVWRANSETIAERWRAAGVKLAMTLAFAWLNLLLLRTAAHYLGLPYRFAALYHSQFIQAMLSIVWTLTAFALMRYAARGVSKPLWMTGAGLLVAVVIKLAFVDLSNAGSIARVVSFIGVGGLMVLIGYLAPLPRAKTEQESQ